jgi:ATP-dependent RNA helicase RhlE
MNPDSETAPDGAKIQDRGDSAPPIQTFDELDLAEPLKQAIREMGFDKPTPVQAHAIPVVLEGRDVIASAQTGTGKTAAFGLPMLSHFAEHEPKPRGLILEPTRELAIQVSEAIDNYSKHTNLRSCVICGGVSYDKQIKALKDGVDIIVATPGRLLDHIQQRRIDLRTIDVVVLDEVDRMLDMGFLPDVRKIVNFAKNREQTLFFSATMPPLIAQLAEWALNNPVTIEIGIRSAPAETVRHCWYPVSASQKLEFLMALLEKCNHDNVIVFTRTKVNADMIDAALREKGVDVGVLHSDRSQNARIKALEGFRGDVHGVLVATDIAARGLDIADVEHVINYDIPENPHDYVHRIGRTGRAAKTGDAYTLVGGEDIDFMGAIEKHIGFEIPRRKIEGFDYAYNLMVEEIDNPASNRGTGKASRKGGSRRGRRRR